MVATRATRGASSLRSSSHFVAVESSNGVKPVRFPLGRARLATKPLSSGSDDLHENDRDGAGLPLQWGHDQRGLREDDIGLQPYQLGCVGPNAVGAGSAPSILNLHIATLYPTQVLKPLLK